MTYGKNLRASLLATTGLVAFDAGRRNDDEEKKGEDKLDATLDKLLTKMDACMSRMDGIEERFAKKDAEEKKADGEKKPGDAELTAADKAKKDAEEKEKEKEKADAEAKAKADAEEEERKKADGETEPKDAKDDSARADAATALRENGELRKRLEAMEKRIPTERTDADINAMTGIQARADSAFRAHGVTTGAPRFLNGEDALGYRRRLARDHQAHSKAWKDVDLGVLNDSVMSLAEDAIYADSLAVAADPATHASGGLRMVRGETASGHKEIKFYGQPKDWMGRFGGSQRFVTKLNPTKQEIN